MKQSTAKKPRNSHADAPRETFSFGSQTLYADKDEYVGKELTFDVLAIAFEAGRGFEGGDRWAITIKPKDRDPEILTLGSNPKRDEQLREALAHLDGVGPITNKQLRRSGNAYYFVNGE